MHYELSYKGMTPEAAHAKAIQDIKDYLGTKKYNQVTEAAREDIKKGLRRDFFITSVNIFAGIQGFPAVAWAKEIFGEATVEELTPEYMFEHFTELNEDCEGTEAFIPVHETTGDMVFATFKDYVGMTHLVAEELAIKLRFYAKEALVAPKPDPK